MTALKGEFATRTPRKTREATAYHEAGHCVAAWSLGYRPKAATVLPGGNSAGETTPLPGITFQFDGTDLSRLRVERAIIVCLAGPAAQKMYRRSSWRRWHGGADYAIAADLALRVSGSAEIARAFLKWLELRAESFVREQWQDIARIANGLLERGTLTNDEIATLLLERHSYHPASQQLHSC